MRISSFLLTLCCGLALPTASWSDSITAGLADNFASPAEPASPSSELQAGLPGTYIGFDVFAKSTRVGHTFELSSSQIESITLEIKVRAGDGGTCKKGKGCTNGSESDYIAISFTDELLDQVWKRSLGTTPAFSEGLVNTPWLPGTTSTLMLDLAALPLAPSEGGGTLNILPLVNQRGFLDVVVADDSAVDYMALHVQTFQAVPEPTTTLFLGLGLTGLAALPRRKRA